MIVGSKVRQADRYNSFRDFIRHFLRKKYANETNIDTRVDAQFGKLKSLLTHWVGV
jgi:hypothetical protein